MYSHQNSKVVSHQKLPTMRIMTVMSSQRGGNRRKYSRIHLLKRGGIWNGGERARNRSQQWARHLPTSYQPFYTLSWKRGPCCPKGPSWDADTVLHLLCVQMNQVSLQNSLCKALARVWFQNSSQSHLLTVFTLNLPEKELPPKNQSHSTQFPKRTASSASWKNLLHPVHDNTELWGEASAPLKI